MINPFGLRQARSRVPRSVAPDLVEDDCWRLYHGWYGPIAWPLGTGPQPTALFVGARSGLEAFLVLERVPDSLVVVVERDPQMRTALATALREAGEAYVVSNFDEAFPILQNKKIGFCRFEIAHFTMAQLTQVQEGIGKSRINHLCGEFTNGTTDEIGLYRLSRDVLAESFFWRPEHGTPFGSDMGPVEVEVSVIVPMYKVSAQIDECLASLAEQVIAKLEVIAVDDGSLDDSADRAECWAGQYPGRIRVVRKPNGGCASARMAGVQVARGEFVGFVDGDDWVDLRMFEELYRIAVLGGSEIAQCGYTEVFPDSASLSHRDTDGSDGPHGLTGIVNDLGPHMTFRPAIWRRIYRRDFLRTNDIQFPEHIRRFDDLPFQFEALARARAMAVIPDPFYFYRQGRGDQDIGVRDDRLFVHFAIFDWIQERVMSWADAPTERRLCVVELNTHLWALSRIEPRYRSAYLAQARSQFLRGRMHLNRRALLRLSAQHSGAALRFALGGLVRHSRSRCDAGSSDKEQSGVVAGPVSS